MNAPLVLAGLLTYTGLAILVGLSLGRKQYWMAAAYLLILVGTVLWLYETHG